MSIAFHQTHKRQTERDQKSSQIMKQEGEMSLRLVSSCIMAVIIITITCHACIIEAAASDEKSAAVKIPFTPCGGKVLEVRAYGCKDNSLPCIMHRGTLGRVEVDFIAPFDSRSLYADVRGRVGSGIVPVYLPLQGFHKEACIGHGITCPVKQGSRLTYSYEMLVDQGTPALQTDAIWKMTDFWGFNVACFRVDLHID